MNIVDDVKKLLEIPNMPVFKGWYDEVHEKYPYFFVPSILYLQRNKSVEPEARGNLLAEVAISIPDRQALYEAVGEDAARFKDFYPREECQETPDTDTTIDSFLDKFGNNDEKELAALNQIIFNPTPDYAQMLAAEEQKSVPEDLSESKAANVSANDLMINKFIAQSKERQGHFPATIVETPDSNPEEEEPLPTEPVKEPIAVDDSMLSESLAKIYIKQGKYTKALEIIKNISLKFPEKSIYFADQIRFLKKLILNEQIKNKN